MHDKCDLCRVYFGRAHWILRQISHSFETILTPSALLMVYIQKVYVEQEGEEDV